MPCRILTVLEANIKLPRSINLLPLVITLTSEQLDFMVLQFLKALAQTHTRCYTVPVWILHSSMPSIFLLLYVCGCVFSEHGGSLSLAADRHKPGKACQSNTCNLLLNVRRVKYAHPPRCAAIPKPNLIIPVCVSTVFIKRFHHFLFNTIKWKCNQTHKLQSNWNSLQRLFSFSSPLYSDYLAAKHFSGSSVVITR